MEWWPEVAVVVGVATLGWRMLDAIRKENREAHASIGNQISQLRDSVATDFASLRKEQNEARTEVAKSLRTEIASLRDNMGTEIASLRDNMGSEIASLRDNMGSEIASLRKEQDEARNRVAETLGSEIAQLREGQANLREGLAEIRGELTGIRHSVDTLRDDFRAHVLGGTVG